MYMLARAVLEGIPEAFFSTDNAVAQVLLRIEMSAMLVCTPGVSRPTDFAVAQVLFRAELSCPPEGAVTLALLHMEARFQTRGSCELLYA